MLECAPDQRAGQAVRATRRDLNLEEGAGELGFGELDLTRHEMGKKWTTSLSLSASARREFVEVAFAPGGYLYQLEQAYQAHLRGEEGGIEDYHLWPAGRLSAADGLRVKTYLRPHKQKKRSLRTEPTHLTSARLIKLLHQYTDSIGITRVKGRAWYGLRRVMSDLAEDVETDSRALRQITGWKDDSTRRRYQKKKDKVAMKKAAVARGKIRELVMGEESKPNGNGGGPGAGVAIPGVDLSSCTTEQLLALVAAAQARLSNGVGNGGEG
jgi:hypothetical protein